jgi:hypothetical protein
MGLLLSPFHMHCKLVIEAITKACTKALGNHFQMFHHTSVDEVCKKFEKLVPIHEHGANWCICQVKVVLTRLDI